MRDQAAELRNLVLRSLRPSAPETIPAPRLVVLSGGKGGVGTTTVAVNLSVALSQQGSRVVLVDADLCRSDVAALCGLQESTGVEDVLAARRDIHEVLQLGPAGVQVIPGVWAPSSVSEFSEKSQQRLTKQLKTLGRHADMVLLDAGSGSSQVMRRFWREASDILLVTVPDPVAVMDSYAKIKTLAAHDVAAPIRVVANQAPDLATATDLYTRIQRSCQRFLRLEVGAMAHIPSDTNVPAAAGTSEPFIIQRPACPAAQAIMRMASALIAGEVHQLQWPTAAAA